jgi:hypothetical protein
MKPKVMENDYCQCRISSASAHHNRCINEGCGKRIETIYSKYSKARDIIAEQATRIKELEETYLNNS